MQEQLLKGRHRGGRIGAIVFNLCLIGLAAWVYFNQQWVLDQAALFNYQPASTIKQLANNTTMTPLAERYFYASHPSVDNRSAFNQHCSNADEKTIVLGCYTGRMIYIFDVSDPRLPGVREVTAAHEMLHAAYARLSESERMRVNELVKDQLSVVHDQHIEELVAGYNRTEPGQLDNEMHSILGTEVAELSPALESYYAQYFTDRHRITGYAMNYQAVFSDLQAKQAELSDQLNRLADEINRRSNALNAAVAALNTEVSEFNDRANKHQFATQAEFDAQRNTLVNKQQSLQAERQAIQTLIDEYNTHRAQLEALNLEASSLNSSINSNLPAIPSL